MSSVGKFVHDSNKAPDSPPHPHKFSSNQRHCFHCKDELGDGEFCQRCTCKKCGSGLNKGFCFICASSNENSFTYDSNLDFVDDSPNPPPQPPTYSCEFCGNGAHYGYNCPLQVSIISNPEPCNNQTVDELPQSLPSFDSTCYSRDGSSFIYDSTPNFVNDSPNVFNPSSQPPTYSCEFCGNDAHYGYDCPPQVPFIYNPEPCYNQDFNFPQNFQELRKRQPAANIDQLPPQEMSIQDMEDLKQQYLDEMKSLINEVQIKDYRNEKIDIKYRRECEIKIDELKQNFNGMSTEIRKKEKELMPQEQAAYVRTSQRFNFIDDDDDDEYSFATQEYLKKFSFAIIPDLPKSDSLIMEDKHLDTIPETESGELIKSSVEDLVHTPSESNGISEDECDLPVCDDSSPKRDEIDFLLEEFAGEFALIAPIPPGIVEANFDPKGDIHFIENLMYDNSFPRPPETLKDDSETLVSLEVVEIVVPEVGGIDTDILLTIKDDILREKLLNVNLLIAKIKALKDNPTPSSDVMTKSSSTSPNFFLEETNTVDNSLPETETFCFNPKEISSGSPTSYSDLSLPDYEAFYLDDDHVKEKSSGSTTTHADFSQYDSFIFDLSINSCPPADRSDCYHDEFAGELAHIISPPEYDCFYFKNEPDLGNFTMDVVDNNFDNPTREPRVHVPNILPTHPTLYLDSDFTLSSDSLRSNLVVSFPSGTRNKIFDPGIFIRVQSMIFLSPDEFSGLIHCVPLTSD
ncbi:hypothetical protein Tco_0626216 [Tanacetum coccineum]|uniref:CCHC-type domain-containing protein n=1 Tax=Tanacetum coccineum TaxID=301880 RepID=A0ABQ4WIZ3_9ASTR